jgi:hypothetical protein
MNLLVETGYCIAVRPFILLSYAIDMDMLICQ